ncbi:MAG: DUF7586 domain-containing protein, partial [Stackebrandtia sp.]
KLSVEEDPAAVPTWRIGEPVPGEYESALGHWWSEGFGFDFCWRDGALRAHADGAPAGTPPAVFAPEGDNRLRTVSGREAGELLTLVRDGAGAITRMDWAGYPVVRQRDTPLLEG